MKVLIKSTFLTQTIEQPQGSKSKRGNAYQHTPFWNLHYSAFLFMCTCIGYGTFVFEGEDKL